MSDTVDVPAVEVDPLLDETITLTFTVREVNNILSALGNLPFLQAVGIINNIHSQCTPQVEEIKKNYEPKATS
jgi:hypothetical protein